MRRLFLCAFIAAALAFVAAAVPVQADPDDKVRICHIPGHEGDATDFKQTEAGTCHTKLTREEGRVIEISVNAVCAHIPRLCRR